MHKHFKLLLLSILGFSISFLIWSMVNVLFLAKLPLAFYNIQKDNNFYNIHLERFFFNEAIKQTTKKKIIKVEPLKGVKLKAIFENGKDSFIIIDDKDELFLNLNQKYKGYKLIQIQKESAVFEKQNKHYIISLKGDNLKSYKLKQNNKQKTENRKIEVEKKVFVNYIEHPEKIWSAISIIRTKKGYKVLYVETNSIFQKLGLKGGDYILEVNNQPLKNDSDAWNIYKNAKHFDEINIKIKRNNKIKELSYEIH